MCTLLASEYILIPTKGVWAHTCNESMSTYLFYKEYEYTIIFMEYEYVHAFMEYEYVHAYKEYVVIYWI